MFKNEISSYDDIKRDSNSLKLMSTLTSFKVNKAIKKEKIRSNFKEIVNENKLKFEKENKRDENKLLKQQLYLQESEKIRLIKMASSLIVDFLKKYRLFHSISVFSSEIGIPDLLTEQELSGMLKINYEMLYKRESSLLGCVLLTLFNFISNEKICTGTQTEINEEIESKFRLIDQKYGINENNTKELRLNEEEKLKIKRILEKEMKIQLQNEILLFKEVESNNIRVQEQKNYNKKLEELKEKLEGIYHDKERMLLQRERELEKKTKEKEKELDRLIYENNEKLENEISKLREKASENYIKNEEEMRKIRNLEEKLKSQEKDLIDKLKDIDKNKEEIKEFYDKELKNYKEAYDNFHGKEKKEFKEGKALLEEHIKLLEQYRNTSKSTDEEKELLLKENSDLKILIEHKEISYRNTLNECELLKEELKSVNYSFKSTNRKLDMKILKNINLKEQISLLKSSFETLQSDYHSRREDMEKIIIELKRTLEDRNKEIQLVSINLNKIIEENRRDHDKIHQFYQESLKNEENRYENLKEEHHKEKKLLEESVKKFKDLYGEALKNKLENKYQELDKNISKIDEDIFKKTGKLVENKLFIEHMNIYDDMKYNDRLVNWRLLEIKSEENLKKLPYAFENKLVTDSYLTKKLDEINQINVLVDNYTKVKNYNSQDIIQNISSRLKEDIKELNMNSNLILNKSQQNKYLEIIDKGKWNTNQKIGEEISSNIDQINYDNSILKKETIKGHSKNDTFIGTDFKNISLMQTPIIINNEICDNIMNLQENKENRDFSSKECNSINIKSKSIKTNEINIEPSSSNSLKSDYLINQKKEPNLVLNSSKLVNTSVIKNQMCAIKEEDESKNMSQVEENSKTESKLYENKFQNVQDNHQVKRLNKTKNEDIEEIYDQDFEDYTEQSMAQIPNHLHSNDFNALKNISNQGISSKLHDSLHKVKQIINHNISKTSSVNIDKLLQSKYSNYSYKFDEIDSFESSKGVMVKNEYSKAKTESEIIEEINKSENY